LTIIDQEISAALTRLELRETELLAWGIVDSVLNEDEFEELLRQDLPSDVSVDELKDELLERLLAVRVPEGGYRTRMAETLRLLTKLRQLFPQQQWWEGVPLVLDYRFQHRPRWWPQRDQPREEALARLAPHFGTPGRRALTAIAPTKLSGFQERTVAAIADALGANRDAGVMVAAGTGSGKTLAFYMPALAWIADSVTDDESPGTRGLALYPRGELLKDQLRAVLQMTRAMADSSPTRPVRVGTWFGPTPRAAFWLKQGWASDWRPYRTRGLTAGWICPFLECLVCREPMVWKTVDIDRGAERLTCTSTQCGDVIDDRFITLTRDRASSRPPDLLLTTTESLNRQLPAPDQHRAFGLRGFKTQLVLLDEIHTYEGASGAQNALLARRLRHAVGRPLVWVGLSATLRNAESFLSQFTGLYEDQVTVTQPDPAELEYAGAEYLVALRHDPASRTGPLSTTIQTAMLLTRCLDAPGSAYEPVASSNGIFGKKSFVFTDKLDVTNRLYWDLLDAEGWWQAGKPKNRRILTLAHLRAEEQTRRPPAKRESPAERDSDGQWWWLPEQLGRDLSSDEQLTIGRTSSQDVGVDTAADVIVATATLEVGYDDPHVGAVIQHKAPHDAARFVQRRGRAGRDPSMRPWTAVVLGAWGRDQLSWELYDQLFDPELEPRHLPMRNRYVLRMQAVYSTLDWLGGRLEVVGRDRSAWIDVVAPAGVLESSAERKRARSDRQEAMADILREVLSGGPAREHLRGHLRRALGFSDDEAGWQEIDALLWSPPRPLLLGVLPTVYRRLRSNWAGETPDRDSHEVRTRTPLRDFIAGNLFDDLLTPEVEVLVPTGAREEAYEPELLPAIRTLRELMPGNVTRHFGVSSYSRRHWVPVASETGTATVDVIDTYRAQFVASLTSGRLPEEGVALYRPVGVSLAVPPARVRDATSVTPAWETHAEPLAGGREVTFGQDRWQTVIGKVRIHSHATGGGARYRRFALGAHGTVYGGGPSKPIQIEFKAGDRQGNRVALGVEYDVDALRLDVLVPSPAGEPSRLERSDRVTFVLLHDPLLPLGLNWFQRSCMALAMLVVLAELQPTPTRQAFDALADPELTSRLADALHRLGLAQAVDPDAADANGPETQDLEARQPEPTQGSLEMWCRDPDVLGAIRRAAATTWSGRDAEWLAWWRQRFAATVGAIFLEAIGRAAPEVDASDLTIDIDPQGIAQSHGAIEVWIAELAPGGNGHIERVHQELLEDPKRFARLLDRALEENEYERLDHDVSRFLELDADDSHVRTCSDSLRTSWENGHEAVGKAFADLRSATENAQTQLVRAAWTTIVNRMLGPGAHPDLTSTVRGLTAHWEAIEALLGLEIPSRVFGALAADEESVDQIFRLGEGVSRYRRSRVIGSYFWPRGGTAARIELDAGDAFGLLPDIDQCMLREALGPRTQVIEVTEWSKDVKLLTHQSLIDHGYTILRFTADAEGLARSVTLNLQLEPVDIGAMFAYPRTVGAWHQDGELMVELVLDEALI
jgi:hypothetical protein